MILTYLGKIPRSPPEFESSVQSVQPFRSLERKTDKQIPSNISILLISKDLYITCFVADEAYILNS